MELFFEPVIVGRIEGDVANFFCCQLADELRYPAFGLVVFDVGDKMLLMFQSLLVVFHRGAVKDDFLLVEVVLSKEEIVFDEENGC